MLHLEVLQFSVLPIKTYCRSLPGRQVHEVMQVTSQELHFHWVFALLYSKVKVLNLCCNFHDWKRKKKRIRKYYSRTQYRKTSDTEFVRSMTQPALSSGALFRETWQLTLVGRDRAEAASRRPAGAGSCSRAAGRCAEAQVPATLHIRRDAP